MGIEFHRFFQIATICTGDFFLLDWDLGNRKWKQLIVGDKGMDTLGVSHTNIET